MSISSEITRIAGNVTDSLEAVAEKGVTVPSGANSDDLAELIRQISTSSIVVTETPDSHGGTIVEISAETVSLQAKTATPSASSQLIQPDEGYTGLSAVTVNPIPSPYIIPSGTKSITENGEGIDVTQFAAVDVAVQSSAPVVSSLSVTPSESQQTFNSSSVDGYKPVVVDAISSTYVGSGITRRSSSDLSASGATVTAPAGYYASAASKAVTNGSATPASTISATGATVTTGTNTLTLSKSVSNTPTVSAGYISSGTAGNSSVSLTASVTTKAAATYNTSSSDQTISSGQYLIGAQTIRGVTTSGISAANIKAGVTVKVGDSADDDRIAGVTGTFTSDGTAVAGDIVSGKSAYVNGNKVDGSLVIQHYYTGSSTPSSSLGVNGDIYLKTS